MTKKTFQVEFYLFLSINQMFLGRNWKNSIARSIVETEPWPIEWLNFLGYDSNNN